MTVSLRAATCNAIGGSIRLIWLLAAMVLIGAIAVPRIARAQDYPSKNITMLLPFTGVGAPDVLARSLAESIQARTGKTVIVEPRPGGAGAVAMGMIAKAEPDGYTVGMTYAGALIVSPLTVKGLTYDTFRDFTPIGLLITAGNVVVAGANSRSFPDVIRYAKANPGKVSVGYVGLGTRIAILVMASKLGVKFLEVPFQSAVPQL